VFELFVSQLAGIRDPQGPSYVRYFYLLERLAMVKSFVLMIDLKCDDLVRSLFDVLFSSASKDHSIRVEVRARRRTSRDPQFVRLTARLTVYNFTHLPVPSSGMATIACLLSLPARTVRALSLHQAVPPLPNRV
jgi:hypothetical protein